jgi:hypothetical protein
VALRPSYRSRLRRAGLPGVLAARVAQQTLAGAEVAVGQDDLAVGPVAVVVDQALREERGLELPRAVAQA